VGTITETLILESIKKLPFGANYVGELLQHDTSYYLWSPLAQTKWYLITTIDDHSRRILHGDLWDKESSWTHIEAQKAMLSRFGCPL